MRASLLVGLFAALLFGCGGVQSNAVPQGSVAQGQAHPRSWMLPEAKNEDLLYVNSQEFHIYVYSYPKVKLVRRTLRFRRPGLARASRP